MSNLRSNFVSLLEVTSGSVKQSFCATVAVCILRLYLDEYLGLCITNFSPRLSDFDITKFDCTCTRIFRNKHEHKNNIFALFIHGLL